MTVRGRIEVHTLTRTIRFYGVVTPRMVLKFLEKAIPHYGAKLNNYHFMQMDGSPTRPKKRGIGTYLITSGMPFQPPEVD